jgi:hypothetical protein
MWFLFYRPLLTAECQLFLLPLLLLSHIFRRFRKKEPHMIELEEKKVVLPLYPPSQPAVSQDLVPGDQGRFEKRSIYFCPGC